MIRAARCQPVASSPAGVPGTGTAAVPAGTAWALSSAPAMPTQAPGPTPPGTSTVPPKRTVWTASNPTKASTKSR